MKTLIAALTLLATTSSFAISSSCSESIDLAIKLNKEVAGRESKGQAKRALKNIERLEALKASNQESSCISAQELEEKLNDIEMKALMMFYKGKLSDSKVEKLYDFTAKIAGENLYNRDDSVLYLFPSTADMEVNPLRVNLR